MRINRFVALSTGMSRRAADKLIESKEVLVNGQPAETGQNISAKDIVIYAGKTLTAPETQTILLNKPIGYVCSRSGQGSKTIYDLLPKELHNLKSIGRLDKDSSGLLLLTSNGELANKLTHPKFQKEKIYEVELDKPLVIENKIKIEQGINLEDGISRFQLQGSSKNWTVKMSEGRNRQIRRTFAARGYEVTKLHRTDFGDFKLGNLPLGKFQKL